MNKQIVILLLFFMFQGCSFSTMDRNVIDLKQEQNAFTHAYQFFSNHQYQKALPIFHSYFETHTRDADNYEWALFFYGICLQKSKLTYAAFDVFSRLIDDSPNAKIVTHAIEFFEHAIDHKQIQASMIRDTALCTKDLEFVQPPLSHFIDFHQGLCNWEKGYVQWGNQQFNMIPQESRYYLKYRFELARLMIQSNEIDRAVKILQDILKSDHTNDTMKKKSQITLARLYFEQKKYEMADKLYAKIAKYHKDQARFLLERAWTQFHLNHPNQAMGLLIALNAPDFRHQVTPEYYLLKSFIYKQVCNYRNALANVDAFQSTYGSLLHGVKTRQPLTTHKDALSLLMHKKSIKATLGVLHQLQQEKTLAAGFSNTIFADNMILVYDMFIQKYSYQLKKISENAYLDLSEQLLSYEENMRLMHYEIGLSMYQRVKQSTTGVENKPISQITYDNPVIYPFVGEYWNDELDSLHVSLKDQCQTPEEWDVFFK